MNQIQKNQIGLPSWYKGKMAPRREVIIDLTQDSDDEMEDEDDADQVSCTRATHNTNTPLARESTRAILLLFS